MKRESSITAQHDKAGDYEVESFDCPDPRRMIVCSHGGGVRRWDGENFFYAVAEHYADSAVLLVDQNQQEADSVLLNPLPIAVARIESVIKEAKRFHPDVPIIVMAHSMGCGVAAFLDLSDVQEVVFVAPAPGRPARGYIERYGEDIVNGKTITSSDGLGKTYSREFMASINGISWDDAYRKLAAGHTPTYVFEAGDDEIVGDGRFVHRDILFTKYEILEGAKHNLTGKPLADFFVRLDQLI